MCVITERTEPRMVAAGVPEARMAYIPKGSYRILDTWYVGGLRGTGSHDIVVDDVFVPAERTFFFTDRPLSRMPPQCARGAPRSAWESRKRQPTLCSSWERQRFRSIRFPGCGIGRQSR